MDAVPKSTEKPTAKQSVTIESTYGVICLKEHLVYLGALISGVISNYLNNIDVFSYHGCPYTASLAIILVLRENLAVMDSISFCTRRICVLSFCQLHEMITPDMLY